MNKKNVDLQNRIAILLKETKETRAGEHPRFFFSRGK